MKTEPPSHCWTILQDHGPNDGGWGPAGVILVGLTAPAPIVYTGDDQESIDKLVAVTQNLAQMTGKPTLLAKYSEREDVYFVGGSS